MKLWKHSKLILWSLYIIYFILLVTTYILVDKYFDINMLIILLPLLIGGGFPIALIPKFANNWYVRGHLSEFGKECVDGLKGRSENNGTLPFNTLKITGIGKKEDYQSYERLENKSLKLFLLKEETPELKKKIALKIAKHYLPTVIERKLLVPSSFEALKLFVTRELFNEPEVTFEFEKFIQKKCKDADVKKWYDIWNKIYEALPSNKTEKNPLFQFVGPKFESIASFNKDDSSAKGEINFIVDRISKNQLPLVYVDVFFDNPPDEIEKQRCGIEFRRALLFLRRYGFLVIASRGRNCKVHKWIVKTLTKNIKPPTFNLLYPTEVDKWLFNDGNKVKVMWSILSK